MTSDLNLPMPLRFHFFDSTVCANGLTISKSELVGWGSLLARVVHSWAAPRLVAIMVAWIVSETAMGWYKRFSVSE